MKEIFNGRKKSALIILSIIFSVIFSAAAIFAVTYDGSQLVFSGMQMKMKDGCTQGVLNISLKNINAEFVGFTLGYDKKYLEPSSKTDGSVYTASKPLLVSEVFEQNSIFPKGCYDFDGDGEDSDDIDIASSISDMLGKLDENSQPITETDYGTISLSLRIAPKAKDLCESRYIRTSTDADGGVHTEIAADVADGVPLGTLSFKINNPAEFSRLSDAELKDALHITSVTADGNEVTDIEIKYYDEDNWEDEYTSAVKNVNFDWNITAEPIDVQPLENDIALLAPQVYYNTSKAGNENDLLEYVNKYFNKIMVKYSDRSEIIQTINWGDTANGYTFTGTYDQKGGEYTLSQKYGSFDVTLRVKVEPVTLLGFTADSDKLTHTYVKKEDIPDSDSGLDLPGDAYGITDRVYDLVDVSVKNIQANAWTHTPSYGGTTAVEDMTSDAAAADTLFTFTTDITKASLETQYPWLTIPEESYTLTAKRFICDTPIGQPNGVTSVVDDDTGNLIISVEGLGEEKTPIDINTTGFNIYFPDGQIIPSADSGVTVAQDGNGAKITIDASALDNEAIRQVIQEMINIGGPDFAISAVVKDTGEESGATLFDVYRNNFYTADIEVDFSDSEDAYRSSILPFAAGTQLSQISTYLDFYAMNISGDYPVTMIPTTYDGITGDEPGQISKAKVTAWSLLDENKNPLTDTALPAQGTTCYLQGTFADYTYSEFGEVKNKDNHTITVKITTSAEQTLDEAVKVTANSVEYNETTDYIFGDISLNYSAADTPSETFTISNIGTSNIAGLNVHTDSADFVIVSQPPKDLQTGTDAAFTLRAKHGLVAGNYEATVYVSSNNTETLKSFKVKVNVIDGTVYKVTLKVNDSSRGTATLKNGQTSYAKNSEVYITITPGTDFVFKGNYTTKPSTVVLTRVTADSVPETDQCEYKFTITGDTEITINFDDTPQALLHLTELHVYDEEATDSTPLKIKNDKGELVATEFIPSVKEYWVDVRATVERARVMAKPRFIKIGETNITTEATLYFGEETSPQTHTFDDFVRYDEIEAYMNSELFDVCHLPQINEFQIYRYYTDPETGNFYDITYKIHIVRQPAVNVTLSNGNSPFGLIDSEITDTDQNASAKEYFKLHRKFNSSIMPATASKYDLGGVTYSQEAWLNEDGTYSDIDQDPTALFVYVGDETAYGENMNLTDPGWIGDVKLADGEIIDPKDITRVIKLDRYITSADDEKIDLRNYYGTTKRESYSFTGEGNSQGDVHGIMKYTGLSGKDFRPGIYKIEYNFTDSKGNDSGFDRKLVVLARPGNLRSKCGEKIDAKDSSLIYNYNKSYLAQDFIVPAHTKWQSVIAYRVMDVNLDGNVNSIDANNIKHKEAPDALKKRLYSPTSELIQNGGGV